MITSTDQGAVEKIRQLDSTAQGFPMPGAWADKDGRIANRCGSCNAPVEGPETRYRCTSCGRTADEYPCPTHHSADVTEEAPGVFGYPETETAVAIVAAARTKADKDKTTDEQTIASVAMSKDEIKLPPKEAPTPAEEPAQ